MIKLRIMGTESEILWIQNVLKNIPQFEISEISAMYSNKGTSKYFRCYMEIHKKDVNNKTK